ncbi:MAG: T9SS type A sorting domain-containing protein [Ignavibacteria bacterium]|nr:T9SS type A sorting domain-containing protein [Ignavibacteria bacterium]
MLFSVSSDKIYKKVTAEWGWQYLATTTSTSYEDLTETYLTGGHQANEHNVDYRITAVDNQSLESIPSDKVTARVAGAPLDKKGNEEYAAENPSEYSLFQNFPNPFNPVTIIKYQIKEQGLVQLKVYNLLGQEIVTLVNEEQPSGNYEALFDASNLPSGVYIYSLRVNGFVQNNKMTLLK